MSKNTKVTLSKKGSNERTVEIHTLEIPDLWHLHLWLKGQRGDASEMVLNTWHLAHDLKRHIMEQEEPSPLEALADTNWVVLDPLDLRIAIEMMQTMFDVLHQDQPDCGCGEPAEMVVKAACGKERNITKHVPMVIKHLKHKLGDTEGGEE